MAIDPKEELRFDGRVAIVTGAGAGCGREYALLLAKRGAKVVVNDISTERAQQTSDIISKAGGVSTQCIASVADPENAQKIVAQAINEFGRIDIIVNNAGNFMSRACDEYSRDDFPWPHFKNQRYGRIIMVSSSGVLGPMHMAAYACAKGTLYALSNSLAVEGAQYGIQSNAIAPGAFTPMMEGTIRDAEMIKWLSSAMPAWAVAPVVVWLLHESCKTTGEFIYAHGASFGRYFIGETLGVWTQQGKYTPEFVRDHFKEASEEAGYNVLHSMMEVSGTANGRLRGELKPMTT
ncbi:uncharacterized protein Z518_03519 [Rhinocladiella mackenziei CBS 650.93]|uniref:Uncharacterized protein n=1 Tax=Rhinocladiella mackenziei CBS 650.93 TaxID=1442369 RepID=A0A0D2G2T6_9EURO|nr:uncharacterized protein Z518_03519 [Rhinocladiella mackenziei CBS 650.93]KIX08862.1 hypothetical protein Z518_03519 [Rhinocladiella mackenziei CBS 650.93]